MSFIEMYSIAHSISSITALSCPPPLSKSAHSGGSPVGMPGSRIWPSEFAPSAIDWIHSRQAWSAPLRKKTQWPSERPYVTPSNSLRGRKLQDVNSRSSRSIPKLNPSRDTWGIQIAHSYRDFLSYHIELYFGRPVAISHWGNVSSWASPIHNGPEASS